MKSIIRNSIFILLVLLGIHSTQAQSFKIKIIETSDVHGAIFPYNFTANKASDNSLAQIYNYVEMERAKKDQAVILVDNGDILQGDPSVYYYNFEKTDTMHLLADVMNYMGYDVGTVGNHDIETGHPVYDKFNNELNFPWLAANAINLEKKEPYFPPYHIINKTFEDAEGNSKTIKIAFLGLITPGIPNWLPKNIWSGMEFEDMIITAKKWVKIIEEKEKPDLLIGLFHAGIDYTYDGQTAEMPRNENGSKLVAEQVPGFDIVFVGHDHHEWNFRTTSPSGDSVLILGPSARSNSVVTAEVTFTLDNECRVWNKNISGKIESTQQFKSDEVFLNKFSSQFNEIKEYVSRPIGSFEKTISAKESLFGNSVFVDFIHKIQLELTDADISFTAPLSIYSQISEGDIYVGDLFNLYRYENLLYTMELTGEEIYKYLEYSYAGWFNTMTNEDDNLLQFEKDEKGELILSKRSGLPMLKNRYYNFDSAEGIDYIVDITKPEGERIKIISMSDGSPFELGKIYKTAINSYRGNGGGGHLMKGAGISKEELSSRVIHSTDKDLRYYMMKWIEKQNIIDPAEIENWEIIPADFAENAREKDYNLMFGN